MSLINTAWIMGSEPNVPATTIEVTANSQTDTLVIPAGNYYPWDGSASHSALDRLHDALESHSEIGTCTAIIGRDRRPRITCDEAFSIDSWSDLTVRNLLGFSGGEAFPATTHVPTGLSSYLWSPGRCEIPDAPLGSQGLQYKDTAVGMSGDAVVVATTNNTGRKNRFLFRRVRSTRVMTEAETSGQYCRFWDLVQSRFFRWKLYRDITEEDTASDATPAILSGAVLGPYKWLNQGSVEFSYEREISRVELFSTVEIPCILVDDY